jgi:hypothetical protein
MAAELTAEAAMAAELTAAAAMAAELTVAVAMAELTAAGTDTAEVMDTAELALEWDLVIPAIMGQPTPIPITGLTDILTPMATIRLWSAALWW